MEDLKGIPTSQLMIEFTYLEQEINMKLLRYEKLRQEICKRHPILRDDEVFMEKKLIKKGNNKNGL